MKKLLLLLAVMCITFASCKKDDNMYECTVDQYQYKYRNYGPDSKLLKITKVKHLSDYELEFFNQLAADQYAQSWYRVNSKTYYDFDNYYNVNLDSCTCTLKN